MTHTRGSSSRPELDSVSAALAGIARHPWSALVLHWNWKAALLSASFRGLVFCFAAVPRGADATRGVWIEIAFRIAIGGWWGSIMQTLRQARPAWLAWLLVALALPAVAHTLEYLLLKIG